MAKILDVGCGSNKVAGTVGVDINPQSQADVLHDLEKFPYPFEDNEFEAIYCNHIVEHVTDIVRFMDELHRLAKPGAVVSMVTPHYTNPSSYRDPTHRHHLATSSFDFLTAVGADLKLSLVDRALEIKFPPPVFNSSARFEKVEMKLSFGRPFRYLGIQHLANRFLNLYEFYFAYLFPARDIYVKLRVVK